MARRKKKKRNSLVRQQSPEVQPPPKSVQARQARVLRQTQIAARITFGPIPSAEEMMRYQQVQSDLPERIMQQYEKRTAMAEAQAQHRMGLENRVVRNNTWMERLGWFSATLLGLVGVIGSFVLVYLGHSLEGLAGVVASLAALVGLYVWARRDQVQAISKKRAAEMLESGATPEQLDLSI